MSDFGKDLIAAMEEAAVHAQGKGKAGCIQTIQVPDVRAICEELGGPLGSPESLDDLEPKAGEQLRPQRCIPNVQADSGMWQLSPYFPARSQVDHVY